MEDHFVAIRTGGTGSAGLGSGQSKKLMSGLVAWVQCFALYLALLALHQPSRTPDLMACMSCIAKESQKYM